MNKRFWIPDCTTVCVKGVDSQCKHTNMEETAQANCDSVLSGFPWKAQRVPLSLTKLGTRVACHFPALSLQGARLRLHLGPRVFTLLLLQSEAGFLDSEPAPTDTLVHAVWITLFHASRCFRPCNDYSQYTFLKGRFSSGFLIVYSLTLAKLYAFTKVQKCTQSLFIIWKKLPIVGNSKTTDFPNGFFRRTASYLSSTSHYSITIVSLLPEERQE